MTRRADRRSAFQRFSDRVDRITDAPANLVFRGQPVTSTARKDLLEKGLVGTATIRKRLFQASTRASVVRFKATVELPDQAPYDTTIYQEVLDAEYDAMPPGATVDCRVDPENRKRVLLVPAIEGIRSDYAGMRYSSAAELIANGRPAVATLLDARQLDMIAPGSGHPVFELTLEVRAPGEPQPWTVRYPQRVPPGALALLTRGAELRVGYTAVGDDGAVAVDWPATTGGAHS